MSTMRYYNADIRRRILSGAPLPGWLERHARKAYVIQANLSRVSWCDEWQVRLLRAHAQILTRITGVRHVVDHEIPLTHPRVCGLTVHTNMRVVPNAVNASKNNTWNPDQLELL